MTDIARAWGTPPTARYEDLAARFRPVFAAIREGAVARDIGRALPFEGYEALRQAGFPLLRVPAAQGGIGVTLPELFGLVIELGEAEPNLANAYRSHLGFTEDLLNLPDDRWRRDWLETLGRGETVGSGYSETGDVSLGAHSTQLLRDGGGWRITGRKFYTTGSLYADWITTVGVDGDGEPVGALVPSRADGVEILDDWDGFGQALSASGSAHFHDVALSDDLVKPTVGRFSYAGGYFQLFHLATLAGIGRAAAGEAAAQVAARRRVYGSGNGVRSAEDPQVLAVVGRVRGAAYAAGAIVLQAAEALQRACEANAGGDAEAAALANRNAGLEVSQSVTVVTSLILDATTILFDALGASAARRGLALDRHWRNARTIASHNPRIYHDRTVGEFAARGDYAERPPGVGAPAPAAAGRTSG